MNLSLRIKRGIARAVASGKKVGRKPVPSKAIKLMRQFRSEGTSIRDIKRLTGYSTGVIVKYTKGVKP